MIIIEHSKTEPTISRLNGKAYYHSPQDLSMRSWSRGTKGIRKNKNNFMSKNVRSMKQLSKKLHHTCKTATKCLTLF